MQIGFCVIYRWKVVAGREEDFRNAWEILTKEIRDYEGGLGSRLHRAADGTWIAYAQWPSREMWERAEAKTPEGQAALRTLMGAIEERMEPILLDPLVDYLVAASPTET